MKQSKKYQTRVVKNGDTWSGEIVRRVTARKSAVSKKQGGFSAETEAQQWAEKELGVFLAGQAEKNKRGRAKPE